MKRPKLDHKISRFWLWGWVVIFALILFLSTIDQDGELITLVKLSGIIFCLLYTAVTFPHDYLLLAALFATCIADLILAANNVSPYGVMVFLVTQLLHFTRLSNHRFLKITFLFAGIAAIAIALDIIFAWVPLIFVVVFFYATTLIANIVVCAVERRHYPSVKTTVALAGFITFALCDFCTGVSFLSLNAVLPAFAYAPANFFVWLFYYPSQILIANTGKYDTIYQKEGKTKLEVYGN